MKAAAKAEQEAAAKAAQEEAKAKAEQAKTQLPWPAQLPKPSQAKQTSQPKALQQTPIGAPPPRNEKGKSVGKGKGTITPFKKGSGKFAPKPCGAANYYWIPGRTGDYREGEWILRPPSKLRGKGNQ